MLGADSGKFVEVLKLPPGATLEPISEELCAKAAAVSRRFGQDTGQVMLHAIANSDAFAIKSRVTDALTNTAIAHSYYYQATEIKEKIAHLIAVRPEATDNSLKGSSLLGLYRLPIADWLKAPRVSPASTTDPDAPPPR